MTVFELIRELTHCEPNSEVKILVEGDSYGASPSVSIHNRGVINGFDWDSGRVLIRPLKTLKLSVEDSTND